LQNYKFYLNTMIKIVMYVSIEIYYVFLQANQNS